MGYRVQHDEPIEGYNRVYVDDPFGNRIELMEPRSPEASGITSDENPSGAKVLPAPHP
jgi:hypothetical protein